MDSGVLCKYDITLAYHPNNHSTLYVEGAAMPDVNGISMASRGHGRIQISVTFSFKVKV